MARRTKEQEQTAEVKAEFAYQQLTTHPAWKVIQVALDKLQANNDLEFRTASRYIVGFIFKELLQHGLVKSVSKQSKPKNGHGLKFRPGVIDISQSPQHKSVTRKFARTTK